MNDSSNFQPMKDNINVKGVNFNGKEARIIKSLDRQSVRNKMMREAIQDQPDFQRRNISHGIINAELDRSYSPFNNQTR